MNPIIDPLRIEEQWQKFLNYKIEKIISPDMKLRRFRHISRVFIVK